MVYQGDPAIKSSTKKDPTWIQEHKAKLKSGQKPDVMVCRPLSGDEVLRIVLAVADDPALIVHAAALGVKSINLGNGGTVADPEEVRRVLNHAGNLESITNLAQKIVDVSKEGVDDLPFCDSSASMA